MSHFSVVFCICEGAAVSRNIVAVCPSLHRRQYDPCQPKPSRTRISSDSVSVPPCHAACL